MTHRIIVPPGGTIGILGGGQLGRMLAMAAAELGLNTCIYTDMPNSPAFSVSGHHICAGFNDEAAMAEFTASIDAATLEFENIPSRTVQAIDRLKPIFPTARILDISNDRLAEKQFIASLDIATADIWQIDNLDDLTRAFEQSGQPAILKTRRFGYDGKGQVSIGHKDALEESWLEIDKNPAILEAFVPFDKELSIILARDQAGAISAYEPGENHHENHILATTIVPASVSDEVKTRALEIATKIAVALDYVGILAIELFLEMGPHGPVLRVNEIAPRVHNSGHWTLDGAVTNQFEQHIRAIAGWPLGDVARHSDVVMTNLIGADIENWRTLAQQPNTKIHVYGKTEVKAGRKMGHVTQLSSLSD
jgi:5-(carboxyamino)imidazole ribonucleotide synthase